VSIDFTMNTSVGGCRYILEKQQQHRTLEITVTVYDINTEPAETE